MQLHPLMLAIIASAGLGAVIGLIRQWSEQSVDRTKRGEFSGVRTFTFWSVLGCVAAFLFLVVGNLAFKRLRLVQGQDGRALPMSSQGYHKVVAGLLVAGCALGLIWVSVVALGAWGVIVGVFLTALGGVLSFLGYGVERAMRGFVLLSSLIIAFTLAISTTLLALARYVLLWFAAALAWLVGFVVRLLAMPAEAVLSATRRPRAKAGHPPAAALEVSQ